MKTIHNIDKWFSWMDELAAQDYVVIDDFIDNNLYKEIKNFLLKKIDDFDQAGIGALDQNIIKKSIRGDKTYWLNKDRDTELNDFWDLLAETKSTLNRYCYLSLSGDEFHLAHYPSGGFYARHLDQFDGRNNRMISMIIYLNENWQPGDGGQLEILDKNRELQLVDPIAKRCVLFKSDKVPHAVLKSFKDRYSLTGWLLYQPTNLAPILG
ncbi:2OG-Fe(II) oxygenase [Polaribacter sp. Hel_I_88]|uniref:2OG-Fe(II) oxygenase n=1 Tax=Polaribacter sp. Hel_I_88 TaxID=1250006 RepID=UPI00047E6B74|nr:2OG-Fe(II) oxygenase [Polaribacter sp. Hel_I_88]